MAGCVCIVFVVGTLFPLNSGKRGLIHGHRLDGLRLKWKNPGMTTSRIRVDEAKLYI